MSGRRRRRTDEGLNEIKAAPLCQDEHLAFQVHSRARNLNPFYLQHQAIVENILTREVTELSLLFHDGKQYTLMSWRTEYFRRLKLICTQVCVVTALLLIHRFTYTS